MKDDTVEPENNACFNMGYVKMTNEKKHTFYYVISHLKQNRYMLCFIHSQELKFFLSLVQTSDEKKVGIPAELTPNIYFQATTTVPCLHRNYVKK